MAICDKVIYTDRTEAAKAIAALQKVASKRHSRNQPNTTYFCEGCNGWHISSRSSIARKKPFISKMEVSSKPRNPNKIREGVLIIRDFTNAARFQTRKEVR